MSAHGSKKALLAALAANTGIAIAKFSGAMYTGSAAMMSEGVHSLVDTGNQILLLIGMKQASRPADSRHPLGYGLSLYTYGLLVAITVFALGSLVAIHEGIAKMSEPHAIKNAWVNYVILFISIGLEGASLRVVMKQISAEARRSGRSILETVRRHRDPAVFAVAYEETAAIVGLVIALIGLAASQILDMPMIDGLTSIFIGIVLAVTSVVMGVKCAQLQSGQAADQQLSDRVWDMLSGVGPVKEVNEVRAVHFGPYQINVFASVDYHDEYRGKPVTSRVIESITSSVTRTLREEFPDNVLRVWIEPQSNDDHLEELKEIGEEPDALDTEEELAAAEENRSAA
jgi:cation diffusion facilitator family transporter